MTPSDPRLARAEAYLHTQRPQQALTEAGAALAAQPESRHAAVLVARALMALGRNHEARLATERLLSTHPNDEHAWRLNALTCARTHDWAGARQAARRAVALAPFEWRTHHVAAQVDVMVERIDAETWVQVNEAVRLAPDEPSNHFLAGNVALGQGFLDVAERAFTTVLRLDPEHADARNNLGVIALRRGKRLPGAIGYADALRLDPDHRVALRNLDSALLRTTFRLQWGLMVGMFVMSSVALDPVNGAPGDRVVCLVLAAGIAAVAAMLVWRLRSSTSRNLRRYLRALPRRRPYYIASVAATALAVPALLLAAADPGGAGVAFLVAALVISTGLVLTLIELRHARTSP